jgi:phosphomevalonate kinase
LGGILKEQYVVWEKVEEGAKARGVCSSWKSSSHGSKELQSQRSRNNELSHHSDPKQALVVSINSPPKKSQYLSK